MVKWLAIGVAVSLVSANSAGAPLKGLTPGELADRPHTRTPVFRMSPLPPRPGLRQFDSGMLLREDVTTNASVGVGLATVAGRKQGNMDFRINSTPIRRKPGVTFLLHF